MGKSAPEGTQPRGSHEVAPRWPPRLLPGSILSPQGQPCWVWGPRWDVGKANTAIVGCALQDQHIAPHLPRLSPPEKVSMRQGLLREDSIPWKSSLGAFTLPAWGAAWAGRQAQPWHRPEAWRGSRGAARFLQRPLQCCCPVCLPAGECRKGFVVTPQKHGLWPTKKGRCLRLQGGFSNLEEQNLVGAAMLTSLHGGTEGCPRLFPGMGTEGGEWR